MVTQQDIQRRIRVWQITHDDIGRAMSTGDVDLGDGDGNRLKRYWLTEGLHRWATKRHPFTTLRRLLLRKTKNPALATRLAAVLVKAHFGLSPGHDAYRLMHGGRIRGSRVGPG